MKMSMYSKFQILNENLIPLTKEDADGVSIGGYCFVVNGKEIPFDWDAFSGNEENGIFEFDTGYGWFNDFELTDCYDAEYRELGLSREDITAEFLASAEKIIEFHINLIATDDDEVDLGYNDDEQYKINLLEIIFTDLETDKEYKVKQSVLDKFNKGAM